MARRRFYVPQVVDGQAVVDGAEAHHLSRVLRVTVGQQYEISDDRNVYLAEITTVSKHCVTLRVLEMLDAGGALPPITLYVALIKFDRFEWMIEKATEIGVARIVPVEAARSDRGLLEAAAKRVERWRKIARESSQQSRRTAPPEIMNAAKLFSAIASVSGLRMRLEEEQGGTTPLLAAMVKAEQYSLLTGPEGGWHDEERQRLDALEWKTVSLGPAVLRAETASLVAAAVAAQWWFGNQD